MSLLDEEGIKTVITCGKYYKPAWQHYGTKQIIRCDRCQKCPLDSCIGYDETDLCLKCVSEIEDSYREKSSSYSPKLPPGLAIMMEQRQFKSDNKQPSSYSSRGVPAGIVTLMEQSQFNDDDDEALQTGELVTMMHQSIFNTGNKCCSML